MEKPEVILNGEEMVCVEIPNDNGVMEKRYVSKKWFDEMVGKNKIKKVDVEVIKANILHPFKGCYYEFWKIGKDISEDLVDKYKDTDTNELYIFNLFKNGEEKIMCVKKELWDQGKKQIEHLF
jgi:hypothetical protein